MKIKSIVAILLITINLYSQKSSEYDFNTPLPPESYQFKKQLLNNVSLYTGQPSIAIPIYSIDLDGMEIPISISYNTGGIKVEEDATSVGLGWNLNIGGQITRNNHGAPDERFFVIQDYNNKNTFGIGRLKNAIDPNWNTPWSCNSYGEHGSRNQFYSKAFLAGNDIRNVYGNEDSRPDEFYYSFFGHSGKFMFSQEFKKFITFPLDDIKINYDLILRNNSNYFDNFSIQLPNGYSLVLGKDGTSSISQYGSTPFDQSWQLKKIVSTKNKEVTYNYISADYLLYTNLSNPVSQVITRSSRAITSSSYESTSTSTKEKLISEIIFHSGRINFVYGDRIDLQTGAKKLQEIKIYDKGNNLIKRIELLQSYFNANVNLFGKDAVDKRLRLNAVNFYDRKNSIVENYTFDYYLLDKIPSKSSKAQDHWGYFNGKDSNKSLFPENLLPEHHVESSLGFNRDLDTLYTKTFSLKSIKFPERGIKYYDYENHVALTGATTGNYYDAISDERYAVKEISFTLSGYNLNSFYPNPSEINSFNKVFFSEPFETSIYNTSLKSSEISILINSNLPFKVPNYSNINTAYNKVEFYLEKKQDDSTYKTLQYMGTISKDENRTGIINGYFDLGGKGTYRMKTIVTQNYLLSNPNDYNFPHNTSFRVKYRDKVKDDVHIGGLRIKNIQTYTYDNQSGPKYTTYFKYLDDNRMTSGKMMNVPSYVESISLGKPIGTQPDSDHVLTPVLELGVRLSSSSVLSLYKTSGSNVGYTKVSQINYDNTTKTEIKEDNYFNFKEPLFSEIPIFDDRREDEPQEWHRGKLTKKLSYNNNKIIKEEIYNYYGEEVEKNMGYVDEINYELLDQNEMCVGESYVSKHIFPAGVNFPNILKDMPGVTAYDGVYAANKYAIENYQGKLKIPYFKIYTGFDKLKSKITRNNLNNGAIEQTEEYIYNNTPTNIQLTSIKNSTSLNSDKLETKYFYAQSPEMINEPFRNELLFKNMIGIPLKEESFRGADKLSERVTKYGSYTSTAGQPLILPEYVYTKKGTIIPDQLEKKITYNNYDAFGNITQYTIENGNPVSLIWGYNKTLPIAKIENATNTQIATALGASNVNVLSEANLPTIDALRDNISFTTCMISTYSHIPLVGVSTITDPKGDKITYTYDSFGRLEFVKDKDGNLLSENQYNYKN